MPQVRREVILMYSAQQLYELVDDVDRYHEFIPGCEDSGFLEDDGRGLKLGFLSFSYHGFRSRVVTKNQGAPYQSIEVTLVEGPFSKLTGHWFFHAIESNSCQVVLDFEYQIIAGLDRLLSRPINQAFEKLVDVFCERAEVLYGSH